MIRSLRVQYFVELALLLFAVAFLVAMLNGCKPSVAKPAAYGVELEECNRTATTCEESIACENQVRARYGRPLRAGGCQ